MARFSFQNDSTDLNDYLDRVRRRLTATLATRGVGALALTALLITVCGVYFANKFAFSNTSIVSVRTLLIASIVAVIVFLLVRPLRGLGTRRAADEIERKSPAFGGRLDTWVDHNARMRDGGAPANPLIDLLAEDTLRIANAVPVDDVVSRARILSFSSAAVIGLMALVWLGTSGPGYWQYGTSRLWTGWFAPQEAPLYELLVEPGDTTVRKGANLAVTVQPVGFDPAAIDIYAKFESSVDWEQAAMRPQLEGSGSEFTFSAVREPLRYYMVSGRVRTREFNVAVVEMPNVENITLDYQFPSWTGLKPITEDPGGDIRGVKGTKVKVTLKTDKPLVDGILIVGENQISIRDNVAEIEVAGDGEYHIAAVYQGENIRLTDDFFITVVPDEKPQLKILKPGRDWKATSIEEVTAEFSANDDFGLRSVKLHYAVNGFDQPAINLGGGSGQKQFSGSHVFSLEDMGDPVVEMVVEAKASDSPLPLPAPPVGLIAGDLVSYYAVASDGKNETRTDIYFIEIQPFDRSFSQSQQAGGQGGGQQQQRDEISRRQKEIIVATWNLIKERDAKDGRKPAELRESASMLAELQATLMTQAATLVERTRARQLTEGDPKFKQFVEYLETAADFMKPAADALAAYKLDDAVRPEQQALQYLLRAEAIFTDIQISMTRNGGGGGGGGASRDLAEMFELEMDLEKNQYETGGGSAGEQVEQEIDDAFKKLEELARRQEQLAARAEDRKELSFDERWKQEMLKREAEELKRQLEKLQRRQESQQKGQSSPQSQSSSSSGSSSPSTSSGTPQGQQQQQQQQGQKQLDRAIQQLDRATQAMEKSSQNGNQGQQSASRAQQQLQQALDSMSQERQQQSRNALSQMRESAEKLVREQELVGEELQKSLKVALAALKAQGGQQQGRLPSGMDREEEIALANRKSEMGEQLAEIEREMQKQIRRLQAENKEASRHLRSALGELQQSEASTAIQNASDMIRRGMAPYVAQGEEGVARALRQLRDRLKETEELAQGGGNNQQRGLARALNDMESLRRRMEEAAGLGQSGEQQQGQQGGGPQPGEQQSQLAQGQQPGQQQGEGKQPGGQQPGQQKGQGQQGQESQGESPGQSQSRQSGQQGGQSGGSSAMGEGKSTQGEQSTPGRGGENSNRRGGPGSLGAVNYGDWNPRQQLSTADPATRERMEQALEEGISEVPRLTNRLRRSGQVTPQDLTEIRNFVRGLSPERFKGNPKLLEKEYRKMLALLEQLEVQVRRQVELDDKEEVRAIVSEPVPETYREAVAEYYRRLGAN